MTDYGPRGPFSPGDRLLEQYEITRLLGMGGHAYVYECHDQFLDELLAVKVIPNPPNRGRDLLNRARAEAQLLRRLSHPNLVRMHTAAALGDDMVCLVMEKLDGVSLRHLLTLFERLSLVEAASIIRQVAVGVAAAHEQNVVHRDIKPDNIFVLPPQNHVKVLDFGIAKFLGQGLQTSNKHRFQGTPLYMSPEHLRGAGVTVRSDVYQLGTVLFELVAGVNPNLIDVENPGFEQVAFVQITRPTPSLSRVLPNAPEDLDWIVQKATAKSPEQRFASMAEFIAALDPMMARYLAQHPEQSQRIRYVDTIVVQAAHELAAREASEAALSDTGGARDGTRAAATTKPLQVPGSATAESQASEHSAGNRPSRPSAEQHASYHPVPGPLAQARIAVPRLDTPVDPVQARLAVSKLDAPRVNAATSVPPKAKKPLSLGFYVAALAFGAIIGLVILVLSPRKRAVAHTPATTPSTAETSSGPKR